MLNQWDFSQFSLIGSQTLLCWNLIIVKDWTVKDPEVLTSDTWQPSKWQKMGNELHRLRFFYGYMPWFSCWEGIKKEDHRTTIHSNNFLRLRADRPYKKHYWEPTWFPHGQHYHRPPDGAFLKLPQDAVHTIRDGPQEIFLYRLLGVTSPQNTHFQLILWEQQNFSIHFCYVAGENVLKLTDTGDNVENVNL